MRVLILGSGAKDHAIAWWFSRSNFVSELFCAPGNIATSSFAINLEGLDISNKEAIYDSCVKNKIDYVFIGTEIPLLSGVIDYLQEKGIQTFGCPTKSLKLETDRFFARSFTDRHNIPTPRRNLFNSYESLEKYLLRHEGERFVLKSNTMTPSRIMLDSCNTQALLEYATKLFELGPVFLESHCLGLPITATVLLDKNGYFEFPFTSDYMSYSEDDSRPTGGMGAICPIEINEDLQNQIREYIIKPTIYGLKVEQLSYKGVLTFSIILTSHGPILVDYHVRFNDPAAQAMIPLIKNDLINLLIAIENDCVESIPLKLSDECTVAVVVASRGYPDNPEIGKEITFKNTTITHNCLHELPLIFTGAVKGSSYHDLKTSGGRCFTFVGRGSNIKEANENAYKGISFISFEGAWYRDDIGSKFFLKRSKE